MDFSQIDFIISDHFLKQSEVFANETTVIRAFVLETLNEGAIVRDLSCRLVGVRQLLIDGELI